MNDEQTVRAWMEEEKEGYLKECEGPEDALDYLVMDANDMCETQLDEETLTRLGREVLGIQS